MTWTASLLPDDALPDDSLVRQIIKPTSNSDQIRNSDPPTATVEPSPLWRMIDFARFREDLDDDSDDATVCAAEIEALRDWLLPEEATTPMLPGGYDETYTRWQERQRLRSLLTEQARIARKNQ